MRCWSSSPASSAQLNDRRALTARIEEDAFGIILTYRSADEARAIADGIRADVAAGSLSVGGEEVTFTVSVGVAPITETSRSPEAVLEQARSALELAKSQGRNQVVVYDVDQQELLTTSATATPPASASTRPCRRTG
jgi:diguanylate cyclase (GGDEF)-like protein